MSSRGPLAEFLLSVIRLLFLSITVEALQGKTCQNSQPSGVGRSLWGKISGGRGRPRGIFFGSYKTRHILLSNGGNCTCYVPSFWHNTGVWRTDGRTDGIAVANTALAMQALRGVKMMCAKTAVEWLYTVHAQITRPRNVSVLRYCAVSSTAFIHVCSSEDLNYVVRKLSATHIIIIIILFAQ